jgi:succinoglycan biosynthesis transport protein ExoP
MRWIRTGGRGALLRRSAGLAVALGLLGGAAGAWAGHGRDAVHEATSVILLDPLEGNPFSPDRGDDLVNLATEAELVTSDAVGRAVAGEVGADDPADVLSGVSVEVPVNTQLLRITVAHPDAAVAVTRAQAFAQAYLDYRATRTESAVFDRGAHLAEQTRAAEASLARRFEQLESTLPGQPRRTQLEQQIEVLTVQLAQLRTEQAALRTTGQQPGEVVTPAAVDAAGPVPMTVAGAAAGALAGVALAVGLTAARIRREGRISTALDLTSAGYDVLGGAEEPDAVRARVLVAQPGRPLVLLLAGVGPAGDEEPYAAAAIAASFARARLETIHVDLSGRRAVPEPTDAEPAEVSAEESEEPDALGDRGPGLLDVLQEIAAVDDALTSVAPHLQRMTVGDTPVVGDLDDLAAAPGMPPLFADLRKRADVVVVSGTALPAPVTQLLLLQADTVVLWATRHRTRYADLDESAELVRGAGVTLGGVVYDAGRPRGDGAR